MNAVRRLATLIIAIFALGVATEAIAQEKITNPKVGKPLGAAQEAVKKKQWDQALAKLAEADAVPGKSAFEQFQINEFKGYIYLQQKKYAEVAKLYEQNLNSGKLPPEQVNDRLKALVQLNTAVKNYPKVMEFGDKWIKADGKDVDTQVLIAQAHYLQKDYKNAITIMQGAIKDVQQAGKTVDENWLQLVRSSYTNLDDSAGATKALEQLVRFYPKPEYWDFLLSSLMRQQSTDRVMMNVFRLAGQVGVLNNPDEYVELTEMLLEAGLPGEAKSVMEAGYQAKIFDTTDKTRADRYARRLNDAKAAATKDQLSLPSIEKEAQKSPTGQADVALGLAFASFGQYDKASEALTRGLQKGGVKDADQAQMMLGIVNLKLGKKPEAVKAFEQVKGDPKMGEIARYWTIYARSSAG